MSSIDEEALKRKDAGNEGSDNLKAYTCLATASNKPGWSNETWGHRGR